MEVVPGAKQDEGAFNNIYVRSSTGALVPLSSFTTVERSVGPTSINHVGQLQAVTVSFNLAPGAALGDATTAIEKYRDQMRKYYYDPTKFPTYLDQLGIKYPTVRTTPSSQQQ